MYIYKDLSVTEGVFTVGYYDPFHEFVPESDHPTKEDAAARVHYLNGGN